MDEKLTLGCPHRRHQENTGPNTKAAKDPLRARLKEQLCKAVGTAFPIAGCVPISACASCTSDTLAASTSVSARTSREHILHLTPAGKGYGLGLPLLTPRSFCCRLKVSATPTAAAPAEAKAGAACAMVIDHADDPLIMEPRNPSQTTSL